MKALIRFVTRNAAGTEEHRDRLVDSDVITIGRATDQMLHLKDRRARLQHAEIREEGGAYHITTQALAGVTVNGHSKRDAVLRVGDVIEVGANVLRIIEPPAGTDLALTFELSEAARREDIADDWSKPAATLFGLSKRQWSWSVAAAVLLLAFLVPLLSAISPGAATIMRGTALLPDDGLWLAGPVHSAHSATSASCEACHTELFVRVPDAACETCHTVSPHVAEASPHPVLGVERCASCHLEHNEPPQLVKAHQGLCADCHSSLPADVEIAAAADFLDAHPEFRVSLLKPQDNGTAIEWQVRRSLLTDAASSDQSNLRFDHQVHLDANGILTPGGRRVMDCADCHVPERGGARMLPIRMDEHCSDCHSLAFDPDDPGREVPHGNPDAVLQVLVEYYSARLLGDDPAAAEQRIRRPGQALSRADRDRVAAEARVQALAVAEDLFERQACANCHEVSRTENAATPWRVQPVRLTERFFPHANFSHAAHDTEVSSCDSCHAAGESTTSTDLLMPGVDTCRDCHGSGILRRNAATQIPSTCIMCHGFHFDGLANSAGAPQATAP